MECAARVVAALAGCPDVLPLLADQAIQPLRHQFLALAHHQLKVSSTTELCEERGNREVVVYERAWMVVRGHPLFAGLLGSLVSGGGGR